MLQRTNLSKLCNGNLVLEKSGNVFYLYQNTDEYKHKQGFIYTTGDTSHEAVIDNKHIVAIVEYSKEYAEPVLHFSENSSIGSIAIDEVVIIVDCPDQLKAGSL